MKLKQILFFLVFSLLYCFLLIDRTFYNLSGDNLNIGTIVYHLLYPENYSGDFVEITKGTYYLPLFINTCCFIQKLTGNYIFTLQIILFIQLFFTLLTTSYMIKVLFRVTYGWKNILLSLLICMTLVFLPSGEMVGFGTLISAVPRYFFGIFTPLIIVFYYKYEDYIIFGKKIPAIIILGAISGILINVHPPSALTVYLLILIHWFFYRSGMGSNFSGNIISALKKITCSILIFLFLSLIYAVPYVKSYYFDTKDKKTSIVSIETNNVAQQQVQPPCKNNEDLLESAKKGLGNLTNFKARTDFSMENTLFCLRQILFIPFILPFILFVFVLRKKAVSNFPEPEVFEFLRGLFIVGFIVVSVGVLISINFYFGPYFNAFRRSDRTLFMLFELLALYFIVFGKSMIEQKVWRYLLCAGLIFYWILLSKSKGLFQYDMFFKYIPLISNLNLEEKTLALNLIVIISVCLIVFLRWIKLIQEKLFKASLYFILVLFLFAWPIFSGGFILLANHALNSFNGIGAWTLFGKTGMSKGYAKINDFERVCGWVKENTPKKAKFMFLDEPKAHNMKILCERSGLGAIEEIGLNSVADSKVKTFFEDNNFAVDIMKLANEYKLEYILTDNERGLKSLKDSSDFIVECSGKYYSVLKIIRKSNNEKI